MGSSCRAWELQFKKLWSRSLDDPINCLLVGKPFLEENSEENDILVGTTSGRVLILDRTEPVQVLLETKGGSVQALCLHDLTGQGGLDMVVGDSDGVISMFSRQQLLSKHSLGCPVTQMEIHKDLVQGFKVTAGCMDGSVSSLLTHEVFWKLDIANESEKSATAGMRGSRSPFIRCMLSTVLTDMFDQPISTLIVCDGWPFLHLIQGDQVTMTIQTPSTIQSMAVGYFLSQSKAARLGSEHPTSRVRTLEPGMPAQKYDHQQVVLAGQNGTVYTLINYEVHPLFTVGFSLSKVIRFRPRDLSDNEPDLIVCVGHSNKVVLYQDGELLTEFTTSDWPHTITIGDLKTDGEALVLGLMDQTIEVYDYTILQKGTTTMET